MALFFVLLGLWTLKGFLPALAWAAVFAVALWPLYQRAHHAMPATYAKVLLPLGFTLAVALVFVLPLLLLGAELAREAHGISQWAQNAQDHGIPMPPQVQALPLAGARVAALWQQHLSHPHPAAGMLERLRQPGWMTEGRAFGASLLRRVTLFGFTLLTLFVLLKEGDSVTAQLRRASRRAFGETGERVGGQIVASVHGTVTGLVLVGLVEGAVLGVAYAIAGVPHPVLLGAASAVAAILPFGAGAVRFRCRPCVRHRPFRSAGADRRGDETALPMGAAGYSGRAGSVGPAGAVSRAGDHGGADAAVARLGEVRRKNAWPRYCESSWNNETQ
jgi:predicted PurR-regulated permease PerM